MSREIRQDKKARVLNGWMEKGEGRERGKRGWERFEKMC